MKINDNTQHITMKSNQQSKLKTTPRQKKTDYDISVRQKEQLFRDSQMIRPPLSVYSLDKRTEAGGNWFFYSDM